MKPRDKTHQYRLVMRCPPLKPLVISEEILAHFYLKFPLIRLTSISEITLRCFMSLNSHTLIKKQYLHDGSRHFSYIFRVNTSKYLKITANLYL